jgi:uncharacterized protein (DUF2249 family)
MKERDRTMKQQEPASHEQSSITLDVRPVLARGDEPFVEIMETAEKIKVGETLTLIAPFEPVPLYDVLGERGFSHETTQAALDNWIIQFTRKA